MQINSQNDKLYEIKYGKDIWMSNKNVMTGGPVWVAWGVGWKHQFNSSQFKHT